MVSLSEEETILLAGEARTDVPRSGGFSTVSASIVGSVCSSDSAGWLLLMVLVGGLIGFLINGLTGIGSPASSSSESSLETGIWVIFLGLRGFWSVVAVLTAALVVRVPTAAPRLAGRPRSPPRTGSLASMAGWMFSLSGSWNLTLFFTTGFAAAVGLDVAVVRTLVVVFLAGSAACSSVEAAAAFLGRPRVALTGAGSSLGGAAVAACFVTRTRVGFAGASASAGSSTFFGRPRGRLGAGTSRWASCSSSSCSSALVFLLAAVLFVPAVAVLFARAAAVMILVVLTVGSLALAAARARVILLGGDSMVLVWLLCECFVG